MNVNTYNTTEYENICNWTLGQNKANSNPIKPNLRKAKMNVNPLITKDYRKKDDFVVRINKPNFQNGQNERKLTYNKGLQKKDDFAVPKTNPIKPNFKGKKMLLHLTIIGDYFSVVSSFKSFREFWTCLMSWSAYLDV